jgi:DNA-binding MarR family transcriptional regulator
VGKKGKGKGRAQAQARAQARAQGRAADLDGAALPARVADRRSGSAGGAASQGASDLAARWASLSTVLQRHLGRSDEGDGLTRARLSALASLVLGGPRRLGELAAGEGVRPPTMTRLVQAMEADGLVTREVDPADRRSIVVRATARGEALLHDGRARRLRPLAAAMSHLAAEDRVALGEAADLLTALLRDASAAVAAEEPAGR